MSSFDRMEDSVSQMHCAGRNDGGSIRRWYHKSMTYFRSLCLFLPAACLLAQTPPPTPQPAAQPPIASSAVAPDKVIISVDGLKMTAADFEHIVDSMPDQYKTAARGPNRTVFVNNVVQMLVLAQEAQRQKLDQDPQFQVLVRFQTDNLLATAMAAQLTKNNKPDVAQLQKYYDDHKADYEQAKVSHILVRFQGSSVPVKPGQKDLTDAEALAKVQALRQRIEGGEDFAKVATAESDDAGSGAKGGDLGTIGHGQTVAAFEQAAFALKPGELSQPVKTPFGYHLIKLTSVDYKPFDSVRADIERQLSGPLMQKAIADLVKKASVTLDPVYFPPAAPAK
jgi:peptidyl-prolyl cis-trans isomerase C